MDLKRKKEEESHCPGYMQLISPILWMINYCKLNSGFCKELSISNEWLPYMPCVCICDFVQAFYSHPSHLHWITTCTWTMPTAYFSSLWLKKKYKDANQGAILVLFLGRKEVPEVPNVYWEPIYTFRNINLLIFYKI